jgi:ATP adenylyltransferase/5',5'''-P-1,P-4-tetraphosphate phosphorylase II
MNPGFERVVITPEALGLHSQNYGLAEQCAALMLQQKGSWETLARGYASLSTVETRIFDFDGFQVKIQFNPGRITSSSARVDEKSIRERECFLCPAHLPADQRGLLYRDRYLLLCNPFPIFPEHFTITHLEHRPQLILPALTTMLDLTRELSSRYTLVYNGPRCGASAPDHLHLQAGSRGFMPFETEVTSLMAEQGEVLFENEHIRAFSFRNYLRSFIALETADQALLERAFRVTYNAYGRIVGGEEEPMMNILSMFREGRQTLVMFARSKHRPSFFYAEGEAKLLVSPAAVDLGGVVTLPLEKDFQRMTRDQVVQMFEEVCLAEEVFTALRGEVARRLRNV